MDRGEYNFVELEKILLDRLFFRRNASSFALEDRARLPGDCCLSVKGTRRFFERLFL